MGEKRRRREIILELEKGLENPDNVPDDISHMAMYLNMHVSLYCHEVLEGVMKVYGLDSHAYELSKVALLTPEQQAQVSEQLTKGEEGIHRGIFNFNRYEACQILEMYSKAKKIDDLVLNNCPEIMERYLKDYREKIESNELYEILGED